MNLSTSNKTAWQNDCETHENCHVKDLLYTKMKIFHFSEKLESLKASVNEILPPIHIRIKPTNVCNHNCRYCAYRVSDLQLGKDMNPLDMIPEQKMLEIINDICAMGVKAVTFSGGGEPFCYPHLLVAVKTLAQTDVKFAALTNGSRLKGEVSEIFAFRGTWIRVSMDGWDDKSYAAYRNVSENEFRRVINNMKAFKELNAPCYLGVSFIVDRKNYSHIHGFVRRIKDIGVNSVKISPSIVSNNGIENNQYHRPVFPYVREEIERAKGELEDKDFEIFDAYHTLDEKFEKTYSWCPYLQILPVIGADLNVYACQDKAYTEDGLVGSIKNAGFREFWLKARDKVYIINPSRTCNHHCVANTKNRLILEFLDANQDHIMFV